MDTSHTLLELRTGRNSEYTLESAFQLFSSLPKIKNFFFERLLGKKESLSFELMVQDQTVYFLCYCPKRVEEYLVSTLQANYPQILITPLEHQPLKSLFKAFSDLTISPKQLQLGKLVLTQNEVYSLKTRQDFSDVDPMGTLLASLSKAKPSETVLLQFIVSPDNDNWQRKGWRLLTPSEADQEGGPSTETHIKTENQFIKKKLEQKGLKTSIKLAVLTPDPDRSSLILNHIADGIQTISRSQANSLKLKNVKLFKQRFLKSMLFRKQNCLGNYHLTADELATIYHLPDNKLSSIPNIAWGKTLLGEPPENLPIASTNMSSQEKNSVNIFAQTTHKNQKVKYGLKREDRRRHLYVIGKTGTGKSTLLANMAINDLKNDEGMAIIDPHGDLVEVILDFIPSHRINDVVYFNPSDYQDRAVKINLFEGENVEHRELIASGIISIFQKMYGYSWGPRLEYILRNALLTLLCMPEAKLSDIIKLLTDKDFRQSVIDQLEDPVLKNYWINEYNQLSDRLRSEHISSVLNKIGQFVSSPLIRSVVDAQKSSFNISELMNEGKILIANLSQGKLGEDNAALLGAMLITKIQLAAMGRIDTLEDSRRDYYLFVDEFQIFATDSFVKILSEARKYRLNLTLANQYIAQIPEEVQKAIFGNCGSMISFVMGADDADLFQKEYGHLYSQDDLVNLGRYQIINKISIDNTISRPFPAHTLPPLSNTNQNKEKVIRVSKERYAK